MTPKEPSEPKITVFISSTWIDNEGRRKLVEDAVLRAGMTPVGMEHFTASHRPTVEECLEAARDCDVYVSIVAHRYGWIPHGHELSITELEYDAAKGKPRLMFEIDPTTPIVPDDHLDRGSDRWKKQEKLEAFRVKYRADQMATPFTDDRLGVKVLQALMKWRADRGAPASVTQASVQRAGEIAAYCDTVEKLHATLRFAGFKTHLRVLIDLEELYVPLQAIVNRRTVGETDFGSADEAEQQLRETGAVSDIALAEAFRAAKTAKRRGIVLLGDPGSGKTTQLKRLLVSCIREGPASLGLDADVLPVFLPLRRLEEASAGVEAFVERVLAEDYPDRPEGFARRLLRDAPLLLLIDGLDEVADARQRAVVSRWLEDAVRTRPRWTIVVTCRFAGYAARARLGPDFLEFHVRPLTPEQSETFIRKWYRALHTALATDPDWKGEPRLVESAEELVERLREPDFRVARLAQMTRNPLLLTNLCLVHFDRGGKLPRGRARLYEECIDVLLERWREEAKGLPVTVSTENGRRVLQPAALWLHSQEGRTLASSSELEPELAPALQAVHWKGGSAREFLKTVRDESGLLTGWGQDQFGFMHLGFQEYLAASEIRRLHFEGDASRLPQLAAHFGSSWWQEVILLLVASGNPSAFAPFLRELLKRPELARHPTLLDALLEDAAEVSPAPFAELLRLPPGTDRELWRRQAVALRVLERLGSPEVETLASALAKHPFDEIRQWLTRGRAAAAHETLVTTVGGVELVKVPAETFQMGSPDDEEGRYEREGPVHTVTLPEFHIGRYPVTNEEYGRFLTANPKAKEPGEWANRRFNQARQPVVGVSWDEARAFAGWAGCRLPSEAEWEYAARAGTEAPFLDGASEEHLGRHAWYDKNSDGQTHPVGEKAPHAWGLHDVIGNAYQWVEDDYHDSYKGAPKDGSAWVGKSRAAFRVIRGGSWSSAARFCRVAYRSGGSRGGRNLYLGFRVARS